MSIFVHVGGKKLTTHEYVLNGHKLNIDPLIYAEA